MKKYQLLPKSEMIEGREPKPVPKTFKAPMTEHEKMLYRFSGNRYSMRGTNHHGPDDMIPQESGLFSYPDSGEINPD